MRIIKLHVIKTPEGYGTPASFLRGEMRVNSDDIRAYASFKDEAYLNESDELTGENGTPYKGTEITWMDGTKARFAESPEEIDEALFGGFGRNPRPHLSDDITLEVATRIMAGCVANTKVAGQVTELSRDVLNAASSLISENARRRFADRRAIQ